MQFTASEEYVALLEEARDLLAHAVPNRALDEVHLRALRLLVAELKKRKYAFSERPRSPTPREVEIRKPNGRDQNSAHGAIEADREPVPVASRPAFPPSDLDLTAERVASELDETMGKRELAEKHEPLGNTCQPDPAYNEHSTSNKHSASTNTRQRGLGRYVSAAVRRAVAERDRECCAYVDDEGRRCRETSALELHHLKPHARGGPPTEENLSLRCRAHNALAAENDFGSAFMAERKNHFVGAPSR